MSRAGSLGAVALLAGVFAAGTLTGAAGMRMTQTEPAVQSTDRGDRPERRQRDDNRRSRRGSNDRFLNDLTKRLQLNEEQRTQIATLIASSRSVSDSLYRSIDPQMREHLEATRLEIRKVLTDEQRERFDAMRDERRRRGRSRGDPGAR